MAKSVYLLVRKHGAIASQDTHKDRSIYSALFPISAHDFMLTTYNGGLEITKEPEIKLKLPTPIYVGGSKLLNPNIDLSDLFKVIYEQKSLKLKNHLYVGSRKEVNPMFDLSELYSETYGRIKVSFPTNVYTGTNKQCAPTFDMSGFYTVTVVSHIQPTDSMNTKYNSGLIITKG